MAYENIFTSDFGPIRLITINRPKVHNALNKKVFSELEKSLLEIEHNRDIHSAIITGSGDRSFVAGADISDMKGLSPLGAESFSRLGHRVFDLISSLRVPVIAAVNGYALGGGLELALACDLIYADEKASFGLVEGKLGLIPGFGGLGRLMCRVGIAHAKEMIFSSAQINAHEALRIGLINRLVSEGEAVNAAKKICESMADKGPLALQKAKKLFFEHEQFLLAQLNKLEQSSFGLIFSSKDHQEGISAFLDKRPACFTGV